MNSENLALGLLKLEESSKHMLLVKFGDFPKDVWLPQLSFHILRVFGWLFHIQH